MQADALVAAVHHLRALWSEAGGAPAFPTSGAGAAHHHPARPGALPGASPSHPLGLPPRPGHSRSGSLAGGAHVHHAAASARTADELHRLLLGGPAGYSPFTPIVGHGGGAPAAAGGLSAPELISHFLAFMQTQGYATGTPAAAATTATEATADAGEAAQGDGEAVVTATPAGAAAEVSGKGLPPVSEVLQQFSSHLEHAGLPAAAASIAAAAATSAAPASSNGPHTPRSAAAEGWLHVLPSLRLSTAASASGLRPGEPVLPLLDASVAGDGMPAWWASSLAAVAQSGNAAVATPDTAAAAASAKQPQPAPGGGAAPSTPTSQAGTPTQPPPLPAAASASTPTAPPSQQQQQQQQPSPPSAALSTSALSAAAAAAAPPAPFNPLLLPGPARTMQAVMAHVRQRHAAFLAQCPEAEQLLAEALTAAAELQAAQDKSLIRVAVHRQRGGTGGGGGVALASRRGTPLGTPTGRRSLSPNVSVTSASALSFSTAQQQQQAATGGSGKRPPSNLSVSSTTGPVAAAGAAEVGAAEAAAMQAAPSGGFTFPDGMLTPVSGSPRGVATQQQRAAEAAAALREAAEREIQPDEAEAGAGPRGSGAGAAASAFAAEAGEALEGGGAGQPGGEEEVGSTGGEARGASIEVGDLCVLQEVTAEEYAAGARGTGGPGRRGLLVPSGRTGQAAC